MTRCLVTAWRVMSRPSHSSPKVCPLRAWRRSSNCRLTGSASARNTASMLIPHYVTFRLPFLAGTVRPLAGYHSRRATHVTDRERDGFRFGLEAEFLLVDAASFRPLWHRDLKFETLNSALEA